MGVTFDKLLSKPLLHKHKTGDITGLDTTYLKLDQSTPQETIGTFTFENTRNVDSITLERDVDGYITKLSYENGREVNITRTSGEITSWEDGDYEWTVVRDDGNIVGVDVNNL